MVTRKGKLLITSSGLGNARALAMLSTFQRLYGPDAVVIEDADVTVLDFKLSRRLQPFDVPPMGHFPKQVAPWGKRARFQTRVQPNQQYNKKGFRK